MKRLAADRGYRLGRPKVFNSTNTGGTRAEFTHGLLQMTALLDFYELAGLRCADLQ